jgi:hypothetical protein
MSVVSQDISRIYHLLIGRLHLFQIILVHVTLARDKKLARGLRKFFVFSQFVLLPGFRGEE